MTVSATGVELRPFGEPADLETDHALVGVAVVRTGRLAVADIDGDIARVRGVEGDLGVGDELRLDRALDRLTERDVIAALRIAELDVDLGRAARVAEYRQSVLRGCRSQISPGRSGSSSTAQAVQQVRPRAANFLRQSRSPARS